jgi:hypothetical protein
VFIISPNKSSAIFYNPPHFPLPPHPPALPRKKAKTPSQSKKKTTNYRPHHPNPSQKKANNQGKKRTLFSRNKSRKIRNPSPT